MTAARSQRRAQCHDGFSLLAFAVVFTGMTAAVWALSLHARNEHAAFGDTAAHVAAAVDSGNDHSVPAIRAHIAATQLPDRTAISVRTTNSIALIPLDAVDGPLLLEDVTDIQLARVDGLATGAYCINLYTLRAADVRDGLCPRTP
jgi:hypothetical protein